MPRNTILQTNNTFVGFSSCMLLNLAAVYGNLNAMKWFLKNGCIFNVGTFNAAAENGNLDNMKWLLANKCPWDYRVNSHAAYHAAGNGNFDTLKWLLENGCPCDVEHACFKVNERLIYGGHTQYQVVIKWIKENYQPQEKSWLSVCFLNFISRSKCLLSFMC